MFCSIFKICELSLTINQILAISTLSFPHTSMPRGGTLPSAKSICNVLCKHWNHGPIDRSHPPNPADPLELPFPIVQRLQAISPCQLDCRRHHEDVLVLHSHQRNSMDFQALRYLPDVLRFVPWRTVLGVWRRRTGPQGSP